MSHLVICYKRRTDKRYAYSLNKQLQDAGFTTWIGTSELRAREDWREDTDQAIRDSFAMIVIVTPDAVRSQYVTYMWSFALGLGIPVIPVQYKGADLHPRLEAEGLLDFTGDTSYAWDVLVGRLRDQEARHNAARIPHPPDAPPVIKYLVEALNSRKPAERKAAIITLSQNDHPAAAHALAQAIKHHFYDVRIAAAFELLHRSGTDSRVAPALVEALHDKDEDVRCRAAEALGEIGDVQSAAGLIEGLRDRSEAVRRVAAAALEEIGSGVISELLEGLRDTNWDVREQIAHILARVADQTAVPGLIAALRDEREDVRWRAADLLGDLGDTAAVKPLIEALYDQSYSVLWAVARALGKLGDVRAVLGLMDILDDENSWVRQAAAEALGKIGDTRAVPGLMEALHDEERRVRWAAAEALGRIADGRAVSDLIHVLYDEERRVRWATAEALGKIGDMHAVPALARALFDEDLLVRFKVKKALERIGTPEALLAVQAANDGRGNNQIA